MIHSNCVGQDPYRSSSQDHVTFTQQTEAVGHSVLAMLCYLGATVVAKEKNREDFFRGLNHLWDSVVYKKLHISGGIGARHDIEGFDVDSKREKLTVRIRIPEYVKDFAMTRNGVPVEFTVQRGYAVVEDVWSTESPVMISYENLLRRVYANPKVQEDNGKVAVMYGPYVMCVEGIDNDDAVDIEVAENPELTLCGENVYGKAASGKEFSLIPYYKWCNRGDGEADAKMTVWMKQENMHSLEELAAQIGEKLYDIYE